MLDIKHRANKSKVFRLANRCKGCRLADASKGFRLARATKAKAEEGSLTSRSIELQRRPRIVEKAARIKGAASIDGEAPPTLNVPSPPKEIVRSEFLRQETSITPGFPINDCKNPAHSFAAHLFIFVFASRVAAPGVRDNKVGTGK